MTITLHDFGGEHSLTFYTGNLAADAAVFRLGHEPNGYFWEGVVRFEWPEIVQHLEFDSEAGMFCAIGDASVLAQLKAAIEPVITSPAVIGEIIERAESSGFKFDD